ncbi:C40 family peptidase [Streptomyces aureus]|uniref:C40 family peptidase n=1 Tax=Streptomyces aureus TaxID=193461 RepID=UPI000690241D|nr:C40 family peptidase [Streptomyces aureus]
MAPERTPPSGEEVARRLSSLYDQAELATGNFNGTRASANLNRGPARRGAGQGGGSSDPGQDDLMRKWFNGARSRYGPSAPAALPADRLPDRGGQAPRPKESGRGSKGSSDLPTVYELEQIIRPVAELTAAPMRELTAGPAAEPAARPALELTAGTGGDAMTGRTPAVQGAGTAVAALPAGPAPAATSGRSTLNDRKQTARRKIAAAQQLMARHAARQSMPVAFQPAPQAPAFQTAPMPGAFDTGSMPRAYEAAPQAAAFPAAAMPGPFDTGSMPRAYEPAPRAAALPAAPMPRTAFDTGSMPRAYEAAPQAAAFPAAAMPGAFDTGSMPRAYEAAPQTAAFPAAPMPQMYETGSMPQVFETGSIPQVAQTGSMPRVSQTGPIPQVSQTGPIPQVSQTGSMPRVPEQALLVPESKSVVLPRSYEVPQPEAEFKSVLLPLSYEKPTRPSGYQPPPAPPVSEPAPQMPAYESAPQMPAYESAPRAAAYASAPMPPMSEPASQMPAYESAPRAAAFPSAPMPPANEPAAAPAEDAWRQSLRQTGSQQAWPAAGAVDTSPGFDIDSLVAAAPPVAALDSRAAQAVAFARAQVGRPCVWGASGPGSYDPSGLTQAAWKSAGVMLPRAIQDQAQNGPAIDLAAVQPGDLVFFHANVSHVGIYVGDGMMVHAPSPGAVITEESVDHVGRAAVHSVVRPV